MVDTILFQILATFMIPRVQVVAIGVILSK
jgi:hypothetical protein